MISCAGRVQRVRTLLLLWVAGNRGCGRQCWPLHWPERVLVGCKGIMMAYHRAAPGTHCLQARHTPPTTAVQMSAAAGVPSCAVPFASGPGNARERVPAATHTTATLKWADQAAYLVLWETVPPGQYLRIRRPQRAALGIRQHNGRPSSHNQAPRDMPVRGCRRSTLLQVMAVQTVHIAAWWRCRGTCGLTSTGRDCGARQNPVRELQANSAAGPLPGPPPHAANLAVEAMATLCLPKKAMGVVHSLEQAEGQSRAVFDVAGSQLLKTSLMDT